MRIAPTRASFTAIQPGDNLYVVQVYDDGWCMCEDQRGNKGVVPVRCLEG